MADDVVLNLTTKQAVLISMCIATTTALANGVVPYRRHLAEIILRDYEDITRIMDSLTDQVCGYPDAADVEEWLRG